MKSEEKAVPSIWQLSEYGGLDYELYVVYLIYVDRDRINVKKKEMRQLENNEEIQEFKEKIHEAKE